MYGTGRYMSQSVFEGNKMAIKAVMNFVEKTSMLAGGRT